MKKIHKLIFLGSLFFGLKLFASNHFDPNINIQTVSENNQRIQTLAQQCTNSSREQSEHAITLNSYNKMKELKKKRQNQKISFENNKK